MSAPGRWLVAAAALLTFAALAAGIERTELWSPDEPRVAEVAREMHAGGSWLVPRLNGEPFLEEPPLFYWLQAAGYRLAGGASAAVARAPAVAGAVAGVLATALVARVVGAPAGIAALVLATAPEYWWMARSATPDSTDAAMTTVALGLFFVAWRTGRRLVFAGAVVAAALAFWLKSFLGVGLVGLVAATFMLVAGRGHLGWRALALGAVALAGAAGLWLVVLWQALGQETLGFFLLTNHLDRVVGRETIGHVRSPLYYVPSLALGLLPWSVVVPAAVLDAWRARADRTRLFPLVWVATMVGALSCALTKRPHYALPAYAGFAVLVAQWWPSAADRPGRVTERLLAALFLVGCPAIVVVLLGLRPAELLEAAPPRRATEWLVALWPTAVGREAAVVAAVLVAIGLVFVAGTRARSGAATLVAAAAAATVVHLVIVVAVLPRFDPFVNARALGEALAAAARPGVPLVSAGFSGDGRERMSGLLFYARRLIPAVPLEGLADLLSQGPGCAVVDAGAYARLADDPAGAARPARAGRLRVMLLSGRGGGCP